MPALRKISFEDAIRIAVDAGLIPVTVSVSGTLRFAKKENVTLNNRLHPISWSEFEQEARRRGLAVYESGGWMRLMRDRGV